MAKDEREEQLIDTLKGVKSALDEERAGRRKLEQEIAEMRKVLYPDTEIEASMAPTPVPDPMVKEAVDYIRGQKAADEEKKKAKKERYKLSTPEQNEREADELWQTILENAEKEVD